MLYKKIFNKKPVGPPLGENREEYESDSAEPDESR
jgi:hypothetical protein